MKKNNTFRRAAALMAALSITVSLAAPAFADTYYIDYGDITITKNEDGSQTIKQGVEEWTDKAGEETVITTSNTVITTLESDLEGPAAEDSGFGPVAEDNYQPAQPEDAEKPEGADQPESTEKSEDADRQESADQQAAPAAAPAASTPKNDKGNGFWGNTITVINNCVDKVLNLTLKDVKIDVSDTGGQTGIPEKAALSVQGKGNVEIELDGDNVLKSATNKAGLEKNESDSTGMLTLKDDNKDGSLRAEGGDCGAGIGGGNGGIGENIKITDGTVNATGGWGGAGIGGGDGGYGGYGNGKNITITDGTVTATGGDCGAGIGGGVNASGSNVTVSGAAQVTATAGKSNGYYGAGATIGSGGNETGGQPVDGEEIQADIRGVTTGYIHHIIYEQDGTTIKREWWEPESARPTPDVPADPNVPEEESNEVDMGTPWIHVETLEGDLLPFDARQQGGTLRVTSDTLAARLHGTRQALEALREQGVEQIQFVTSFKTTTLPVADLLAEGGSWFALEHNGLVSRRLSAAQAESLKCQMR